MPPPIKEGMDYFPHQTNAVNDEKIDAMRSLYGNDGYAFYFILLERIYKSGGILDVRNPAIMSSLQRSVSSNEKLFEKMLKTSFELQLFDQKKYEKNMVLTSVEIKQKVEIVKKERERKRAYRAAKAQSNVDVHNLGTIPEQSRNNLGTIPDVPPKEKERKEKERKEKESKRERESRTHAHARAPQLEEITGYCQENGLRSNPELFYSHYTARGWLDKNGQEIADWKALLNAWECREAQFSSRQQRNPRDPRTTSGSSLDYAELDACIDGQFGGEES